jgi:hypothetical protein
LTTATSLVNLRILSWERTVLLQNFSQYKNMMGFRSALLCILAGAMIANAEKSGMLSSGV